MASRDGYTPLTSNAIEVEGLSSTRKSGSKDDNRMLSNSNDRLQDLAEVMPPRPPSRFEVCVRWIQDNMVIVPDKHHAGWLNMWDMWVMMLLFLAAFYEPFNLALATRESWLTDVFNEVLDVSFTTDLIMHFFLAYPNSQESSSESIWQKHPVMIAKRYMGLPLSDKGRAGWFWIDLLSVAPGWFELFLKLFFPGEADSASTTTHVVHFFRFFRLIRMTRMVRLAWVVERWHAAYGWPFYVTEIFKFVLITVITCHWAACTWVIIEGKVTRGYISYNSHNQESWLSVLIDSKGDSCSPDAKNDPLCVYNLALYWAMMTLTTVGYGDITPQNQFEYTMCTGFMLISGFIWAYIVGSVVSLLGSLDPHGMKFRQNMDDLNDLMSNRDLPHSLQVKLRTYMLNAKHIARLRSQQGLLKNNLSNGLQGEIAEHTPLTGVLRSKVFWTKELEQGALLQIVTALVPHFYSPHEVIKMRERMVILRDGLMGVRGRVCRRGDVFGHDTILLESAILAEVVNPMSLSYLDLLALEKEDLREVCRNFPMADRRIRRAQIRTAVFRNFLRHARERIRLQRLSVAIAGERQSASSRFLNLIPEAAGLEVTSFANLSSDHSTVPKFLPDALRSHQQDMEQSVVQAENRINRRHEELSLQMQTTIMERLEELKHSIAVIKEKKGSKKDHKDRKLWLRSSKTLPAGAPEPLGHISGSLATEADSERVTTTSLQGSSASSRSILKSR